MSESAVSLVKKRTLFKYDKQALFRGSHMIRGLNLGNK